MTRNARTRPDDARQRWQGRRRLSTLLRLLIMAVPVLVAAAAGLVVVRLMGVPEDGGDRLLLVAASVTTSLVAMVVTDRAVRRLLPLTTLLDLTLLFPDRAPSRLRVARDAVRGRTVEEHLERLATAGQDPQAAAEQILVLVAALDGHDRPTRGHAERVRLFTDLLAEEMGLSQGDRDRLRWASLLHDIGKLTVPSSLLNKPGKPTPAEWDLLRLHPTTGAELAAPLMPWLGEWGLVIAQHHERYDGTGYPNGLAGEAISRGGRMVAVSDAFDVMTASRAYRRPVSRSAAYAELVRCAGTQFDRDVVRAMVSISAPRLRKAQGVASVLSQVPVLASQTVPAATLARVIGSAALVAGGTTAVATGLVVPPAVLSPPPADSGDLGAVTLDADTAGAGPAASVSGAALTGAVSTGTSPTDVPGSEGTTTPGSPTGEVTDPTTGLPVPTTPSTPTTPTTGTPTAGPPTTGTPTPGTPTPGTPGTPTTPGTTPTTPTTPARPGSVTGTVGTVVAGAGAAAGGAASGTGAAVGTAVSGVGASVGTAVAGTGAAVGAATGGTVGTVVSGTTAAVGTVVTGTTGTVATVVSGTTGTVGAVTTGTTGTVGTVVGGIGGLLGRH